MNVVTVGGGTGQYHTLRALMHMSEQVKDEPIHITAIPTTTDSGGSSGVLRFQYKIVAPGDIGQCVLGLHPDPEKVAWLFEHRFDGGELHGHTTRNIIVATALKQFGPTQAALDAVKDVFYLSGDISPATLDQAHVHVLLKNGEVLTCENDLYQEDVLSAGGVEKIWLEPKDVRLNSSAVQAIEDADLIVVCPGTIYCSIIPNFLVEGMASALCESKATKVYVANLMNQRGHIPLDWTAHEYVKYLETFLEENFFDVVIVNKQKPSISQALLYEKEKVFVLPPHNQNVSHYKTISVPLLAKEQPNNRSNSSDVLAHLRASVRHDTIQLSQALKEVCIQTLTVHGR